MTAFALNALQALAAKDAARPPHTGIWAVWDGAEGIASLATRKTWTRPSVRGSTQAGDLQSGGFRLSANTFTQGGRRWPPACLPNHAGAM